METRTTLTPRETAPERLPDAARLGPVHLVVADLERSLAVYEGVIGLRVHARGDA
jgi:catechol-2,3-dioxygenase